MVVSQGRTSAHGIYPATPGPSIVLPIHSSTYFEDSPRQPFFDSNVTASTKQLHVQTLLAPRGLQLQHRITRLYAALRPP